ncbi:Activating molecule in BECN1-regulated autophagy protein 1, partial [Dichanthelium oligosanthes]
LSVTLFSYLIIRNIFDLLAQREVSPRTKHQAKNQWIEAPRCDADSIELKFWVTDAHHDLLFWAESQSLRCWYAKYCPLLPASRATIAAAFSPDGRVLASTHGDHTVKIIDCQTGKCLKVLQGHQRTPWVVRFHPLHSDILASGSLDCEVRLWDAKTSRCTGVFGFYRPIASIAFHAAGELLAVASGHKLFIWDYNNGHAALNPPMILRTRRSLRAVQFHPHAAPYLLTAEIHNRDSEDSTMAPALLNNYAFRDIPLLGSSGVDNLISELPYTHDFEQVGASSSVPVTAGSFDGSRQHDTPHHHLLTNVPGVGGSLLGTHGVSFGVGSEQAASLLDSGTELPCTVKLRIWRHNIKDPYIALEPEACLLTIPHVVLCRFGTVLASRAVKAAHCLTSVQVYRVSDMELVRVLPSAGDEVNVACFHPSPGAGLVYGTKEGKLRFLQHNGASMGLNSSTGDNIHEVLLSYH